jgi:hypothetical protein
MTLAEAVTVTVGKGDVLGAILLLLVIVPAAGLTGSFLFHVGVNGAKEALRDSPIFIAGLLALSGVGWVLWWVAHWFTSS